MDVSFERFRATDQDATRHLILEGLRERWGDDFDPPFNRDLDDIQSTYVDAGPVALIGRSDDKIIVSGILLVDGRTGEIVRMSVDASHRRMGLARLMVAELIETARQLSLETVKVATDTPWHSAVALYRSCGFTETGHDETDTHFALQL